ncbi:MAG: twin-arginine translocase TatA/TatE family subunit [Phycisphaerales bacterium JB037]
MTNHTLAFFQQLGPWEMAIILMVALLLFGRRLPEVGRSLGRGIVEFKKGVKGIEDEIETESTKSREPTAKREAPAELPESDPRRVSQGSSTAPPTASPQPAAQPAPEQTN